MSLETANLFIPGGRKLLRLAYGPGRTLSLKAEVGPAPVRTFVVSLPKAGTYLIAALLKEVGLVDVEGHFSEDVFQDFRNLSLAEKFLGPPERVVEMPLPASAGLINVGQFGVGHVGTDWWSQRALSGFRKVFAVRDIRDCLVSAMRFDAKRVATRPTWFGPEPPAWAEAGDRQARMARWMEARGPDLYGYFSRMQAWRHVDGVVTAPFETLVGDHGRDRQIALVGAILAHVELASDPATLERAVDRSLATQTLTSTDRRSQTDGYWSEAVESRFAALGGPALNASYGYAAEWVRRPD